jgi:hypothetical protein
MLTMKPAQAKNFFFDRPAVQNAMDAATRKVLAQFGAFVRTRARSSMRRRKKISEPGQPPSAHDGKLKQLIFFAFDPGAKSVVIGPALLNGANGEVPALLEYGGTVSRNGVRMHYAARPAMQPAFVAERSRLPPLWENSLKAA